MNRTAVKRITGTMLLAILSLAAVRAAPAPPRQYVYVGTNGPLLQIDPERQTLVASIPLIEAHTGLRLFSLTITVDGNFAYLVIGDRLERVDLRTGQRGTVIDFGEESSPGPIAVSPRGDRAYGVSGTIEKIGFVQVLDLQAGSLLNRIVPGYPGDESDIEDMVLSSDGRRLYALVDDLGDDFQSFMVAIDTETDAVQRIPVPLSGALVLRDDHTAYVGGRGALAVIDLDRSEVSSTIQFGSSAPINGLAIAAEGALVGWARREDPDRPTSTILTFDQQYRLTHEIPIAGAVEDVVVRADGRAAYVILRGEAELVVLDPALGEITGRIPLEAEARFLAIASVPDPSPTPSPTGGIADGDGCAIVPGAQANGVWSLVALALLAAARRRTRPCTVRPGRPANHAVQPTRACGPRG